ncbi:MAG: MFS transporter [Streptosporangiaceae bacterium]|jgi:MFS family permease
MSDAAGAESGPAESGGTGHLGVLATWRQTPGPVRALLAGVFVSRLAGFLVIFLVLYLTHRGFSSSQAALGLGMYGAGSIVGTFVGGYLSDRISARAAVMVSMGGAAVLLVSIIYLKVYVLILLATLLVGGVGVIYRPAAQSVITELTPPGQLVMVTAMYRLCLNLGTTAAPLIGVALIHFSYSLLFWGEAIASLGYGLIALRFLPRTRTRTPATAAADRAAETPVRKSRSGYLAMLGDVRYLFFLLAFLLLCLVYVQYVAIVPLAIVKAGLPLWWYGAVVALNAVIVVTCEVAATRWVQAWPKRLTVLVGFSLLAAGYAVYAIKLIPVFLIAGTLIWTLSEITGTPTVYAYPGLVAPDHLRGRYFGAMHSMYNIGATLGPIFGVILFDHIGQKVFLWAALVAVAAAITSQIGVRSIDTAHARQAAPDPVSPAPASAESAAP